jgi:hypothetical protein
MEKCNDCKKMVEQAPFGQCDDCFEKSMSENGSVVYSVNSEENEKTQDVVSKF